MTKSIDTTKLGRWINTVTPANTKIGPVEWHAPQKGAPIQCHTAMMGGRAVALIRLRRLGQHRQWNVTIEGWVWNAALAPDTPAAKMRVKESPVRPFYSIGEAKTAVEGAIALLPEHFRTLPGAEPAKGGS